ncbi:MAG: VOC family protein [Cellulosilyticum sp.]|nr:VOC family protein [Cellulosilyticum sp.]
MKKILILELAEKYQISRQAILNFGIEDLNAEYIRLKKLNIGKVSEILYVNIKMPYYYFNIEDPDGNVIEITGRYHIV